MPSCKISLNKFKSFKFYKIYSLVLNYQTQWEDKLDAIPLDIWR